MHQSIPVLCLLLVGQSSFGSDVLNPAPEGSFTVVVLPDTQDYVETDGADGSPTLTNPVFDAHTHWIVEHLDDQRIVFVSHVGDVVERNIDDEWTLARHYLDRLHGVVPYGISVGNHDMTSAGDSRLFQKYFPQDRFTSFDWYGGSFPGSGDRPNVSGNNANSYQLISAEGIDLVLLHLECNAPDDVLAWADDILTRYADRTALVTTHMSLGPIERPETPEGYFDDPQGRMQWSKIHGKRGNSPEQMWEKCFRKHSNLLMIFSGDQRRSTAMSVPDTGEHGNVVHQLLSDYSPLRPHHVEAWRSSQRGQSDPNDPPRTDPLRLYRFLPQQNRIDVISYDTLRDRLVEATTTVRHREDHQFSISHEFSGKH